MGEQGNLLITQQRGKIEEMEAKRAILVFCQISHNMPIQKIGIETHTWRSKLYYSSYFKRVTTKIMYKRKVNTM